MRTLGLLFLAGCIRSTDAEVRQTDAGQEVDLVRHWYGITVGPCGPGLGGYANYSFRLDGPGPVYPPERIAVLDEKGAVCEDAMKGATGEIRVDAARHRVTVDLHHGKDRFEINGTYRYHER